MRKTPAPFNLVGGSGGSASEGMTGDNRGSLLLRKKTTSSGLVSQKIQFSTCCNWLVIGRAFGLETVKMYDMTWNLTHLGKQ